MRKNLFRLFLVVLPISFDLWMRYHPVQQPLPTPAPLYAVGEPVHSSGGRGLHHRANRMIQAGNIAVFTAAENLSRPSTCAQRSTSARTEGSQAEDTSRPLSRIMEFEDPLSFSSITWAE